MSRICSEGIETSDDRFHICLFFVQRPSASRGQELTEAVPIVQTPLVRGSMGISRASASVCGRSVRVNLRPAFLRRPMPSPNECHSRRNASKGSTPDARRAGSQLASAATAVSKSGTPANVTGSTALGL